jgi:hypothetical protein
MRARFETKFIETDIVFIVEYSTYSFNAVLLKNFPAKNVYTHMTS